MCVTVCQELSSETFKGLSEFLRFYDSISLTDELRHLYLLCLPSQLSGMGFSLRSASPGNEK